MQITEQLPGFNYKECTIAGDDCWLVTPRIEVEWTAENARFRSAIIRQSDGAVISQGFRKFMNYGEKPEFEPWDIQWPIVATRKMDGSLLIVSKYKGQLIIRTRGTVDARQLPNGHEIDLLATKYRFDEWFAGEGDESWNHSFLFEWTTPSNVIVLREHNEPTLTLLAVVLHDDGSYACRELVEDTGKQTGWPIVADHSHTSLQECIDDVRGWIGTEGLVLRSPDGQTLKKIKAEEYLRIHRLKGSFAGVRFFVDYYLAQGANPNPEVLRESIAAEADHEVLRESIAAEADHETAVACADLISKTCDMHLAIIDQCSETVLALKDVLSLPRKDQAAHIVERFTDWRRSYAFSALDGRTLETKTLRRLLEEALAQ